jgi:hypothetical protein
MSESVRGREKERERRRREREREGAERGREEGEEERVYSERNPITDKRVFLTRAHFSICLSAFLSLSFPGASL